VVSELQKMGHTPQVVDGSSKHKGQ
jgi:hypothetical protein